VPKDHQTRLILWDIDHTLIETRGLGSQLYRRAFEVATGRTLEKEADVTGQTEPAILTATLRLHGIESSDLYQERYAQALAKEYDEHQDELRQRGRLLPGARDALAALATQTRVIQSVLSGNLRAVSKTKLSVFNLDQYIDFAVGAYGDDDVHRPNLVAIAQRRASQKYGVPFTRANTVVIGDSTHDVGTGHEGGAAVIAVASGRDDEARLREAGADLIWPDLTDTERVIATLTVHNGECAFTRGV
jgi:phosphoglycolate phosphatase-like HAD superfamily hydrolase